MYMYNHIVCIDSTEPWRLVLWCVLSQRSRWQPCSQIRGLRIITAIRPYFKVQGQLQWYGLITKFKVSFIVIWPHYKGYLSTSSAVIYFVMISLWSSPYLFGIWPHWKVHGQGQIWRSLIYCGQCSYWNILAEILFWFSEKNNQGWKGVGWSWNRFCVIQ